MDDKYVEMVHNLDPTFIYLTTSEPTDRYLSEQLLNNAQSKSVKSNKTDDVTELSCDCRNSCETPNCACALISGIRYRNGKFQIDTDDKLLAIECNASCKCPPDCGQRVLGTGPNQHLLIKGAGDKGLGVFATAPIEESAYICEYSGEILSADEAIERAKAYRMQGRVGNYIFWLLENVKGNQGDQANRTMMTIIDPTCVGNIGRFINHSCDANCQLQLVRSGLVRIPKLCIFTRNDVKVNEEITFDYGSMSSLNFNVSGASSTDNKVKCFCQSVKCTGFLPYHDV